MTYSTPSHIKSMCLDNVFFFCLQKRRRHKKAHSLSRTGFQQWEHFVCRPTTPVFDEETWFKIDFICFQLLATDKGENLILSGLVLQTLQKAVKTLRRRDQFGCYLDRRLSHRRKK